MKTILTIFLLCCTGLLSFAQNNTRPNVKEPYGFEVNSYTGNLYQSRTDMKVPGQGLNIDLTFSYNLSRRAKNWGMGKGWTFTYNMAYTPDSLGIWIERPDGRRDLFQKSGSAYIPPTGVYDSLTQYQTNKYRLKTKAGLVYYFDNSTNRRLTKLQDANGNTLSLSYNDSLINTLTDAAGHSFLFMWSSGRLAQISDNTCSPNRTVGYTYDSVGNPVKVTNPLGDFVQYYYDTSSRITGYTDENSNNLSIIYGPTTAVQKVISCVTNHTYSFVPQQYKSFMTELVNGEKQITIYQFDTTGKVTTKQGNCCGFNVTYTYDAQNNVSARKDGMGTTTQYVYDGKGNIIQEIYADGTVVTYTYEPVTNKVASMRDRNGNTTTYQYDANGNLTETDKPLSITEKNTYDTKGNVLTHTDANGNTTTYEYNSYGYQTKVTDALGGVTETTYDCHGNRTAVKDARGNTTSFEYNALNRLVKTTDALGDVTTFSYDKVGNLTATTNALGKTTTYTYDGLYRRIGATTPLGITTTTIYDEVGNITKTTDGRGYSTSYTYNSRKQVLTQTDALGKTITYDYDEAGNRTAVTDKMGNTMKTEYDAAYRPTKTINAAGNSASVSYDATGNKTADIDANGNITQDEYDASGRLSKMTDALGKTTSYTYDGNGNQLTEKDKNGNVTTYTYDKLNRASTVKDALNATTTYTYDANSNILTVTDPLNHTTTKTYDKLNRVLTDANALNETTSYTYDGIGNVKTTTQPNGNITTNSYDDDNRITAVNDVIGAEVTFTYDNNGNRLSQKDGNNNATTYGYDALNRQVQQTDALGKSTGYTYDANDNLLTITDRNGNAKNYTYDALNNRTAETDALGNTTKFTYDANGNRLSIIDAKGNPTLYNYNALNQLVRETYADNTTKEYTYDANGNRKTRKDNAGAITTYTYDAANRMTQRSYAGGSSDNFTYDLAGRRLTANNANATITFTYDNINRVLSETLNGKATSYNYNTSASTRILTYPSGRIISETRDSRDRLVSIKEGANNIATFSYDLGNRLQQKVFANGYNENYTYNGDDWLTSLTCQPNNVINFAYTYDNEGNRLTALKNHHPAYSEKYDYDNLYQLTGFYTGKLTGTILSDSTSKNVYAYDALRNRTSSIEDTISKTYLSNRMNAYSNVTVNSNLINYTYDLNGNLTYDGEMNYTYDNENRLVKVNNGSIATYYYDALGRRIKLVSSIETNYYFDGNHFIEERDANNTIQKTYIYGTWLDDVVSYTLNNKIYFLINEPQGNVLASLNSTSLVENYDYSAFGKMYYYDNSYNIINSSTISNVNGFTGRPYINEAALYDFRTRVYKSTKGNFNQRDPFKYVNGYNLYNAYFAPNNVDPFGLATVDPRIKIGFALYEGFGGGVSIEYSQNVSSCCKNDIRYDAGLIDIDVAAKGELGYGIGGTVASVEIGYKHPAFNINLTGHFKNTECNGSVTGEICTEFALNALPTYSLGFSTASGRGIGGSINLELMGSLKACLSYDDNNLYIKYYSCAKIGIRYDIDISLAKDLLGSSAAGSNISGYIFDALKNGDGCHEITSMRQTYKLN